MNPFRNLIETWLLFKIISDYRVLGIVALEIVTAEDFSTLTTKSVYRSAVIGAGDLKKTLKSIREDYPEKIGAVFSTRLEIMQKDTGSVCLPELDLDEVIGVLRRNDDLEIIGFCLGKGLFNGDEGEQSDGYSCEVSGVRH